MAKSTISRKQYSVQSTSLVISSLKEREDKKTSLHLNHEYSVYFTPAWFFSIFVNGAKMVARWLTSLENIALLLKGCFHLIEQKNLFLVPWGELELNPERPGLTFLLRLLINWFQLSSKKNVWFPLFYFLNIMYYYQTILRRVGDKRSPAECPRLISKKLSVGDTNSGPVSYCKPTASFPGIVQNLYTTTVQSQNETQLL